MSPVDREKLTNFYHEALSMSDDFTARVDAAVAEIGQEQLGPIDRAHTATLRQTLTELGVVATIALAPPASSEISGSTNL